MQPWHNWFHCTGSMYGQWLPGDQRGWRERDHRRHVDADYKHPLPPGAFDWLHKKSQELMNHDPVSLNFDQRVAVCRALFDALIERQVEVAELSIGGKHWHAVSRFTSPGLVRIKERDPKLIIGAAKGKCAFMLGKQGIVKPGGIWAKGCRTLPITDEEHFWNSKDYVHDHVLEGAAVILEITELPKFVP